ncbi:unnamed protein product [Rhizophagus irregularis]|uniref:Uncharacterized protein n=1 Tax=Rhizophagus irregularis TaxID=588596 RepID=A0A2I1GND2_9GLOM|nr:hypothetical protein RhiirA4_404149 [Rhizophagus irregularis]CAB4412617.1 unnamed protein product [Rhizophagus irregularis]CAB4413067.1 unnamed protein product [Rhizophagus irregularis]
MSLTILRNKSLNLCVLLNVISLFFILPSTVICDGDVDNMRNVTNDNNNHAITTSETKEEKQEELVDNTIVQVSVAIMYILFGIILFVIIKTIVDRRKRKNARKNAINDLEMGSDLKKGYDLKMDYYYEKDDDLKKDMKNEIIKPPPAVIPFTKK